MKEHLLVRVFSFSYKKGGIPEDTSRHGGGFVFDCRFLPNPGREEAYKSLTGLDAAVISFLREHPEVDEFLQGVFKMVDAAVENYRSRGHESLMVSFGCTGGQHRSVYSAERLGEHLRKRGVEVRVRHCEIEAGTVP